MHGENNIKCINAQQAGLIYKYHNIKQKLQRANVSILFNKACRAEQLQPIYVNIRVNGDNRRNHQTKLSAVKYRINLELQHLYKKKAYLNRQLYEAHLKCANYWQKAWCFIQNSINHKIQSMSDILYNKLNKKVSNERRELYCFNVFYTTPTHLIINLLNVIMLWNASCP